MLENLDLANITIFSEWANIIIRAKHVRKTICGQYGFWLLPSTTITFYLCTKALPMYNERSIQWGFWLLPTTHHPSLPFTLFLLFLCTCTLHQRILLPLQNVHNVQWMYSGYSPPLSSITFYFILDISITLLWFWYVAHWLVRRSELSFTLYTGFAIALNCIIVLQ